MKDRTIYLDKYKELPKNNKYLKIFKFYMILHVILVVLFGIGVFQAINTSFEYSNIVKNTKNINRYTTIKDDKRLYQEVPRYVLIENENTNQNYVYNLKSDEDNVFLVSKGSRAYKLLEKRIGKLSDLTFLKRYRTKYSTWDYQRDSNQNVHYLSQSKNRKIQPLFKKIILYIISLFIVFIILLGFHCLNFFYFRKKYVYKQVYSKYLSIGTMEMCNIYLNKKEECELTLILYSIVGQGIALAVILVNIPF